MRNRMGVWDRFERDPQFKALVDMLTAWMMQNTEVTPTELREAAMCAASNVELYTMKRQVVFTAEGEMISRKTGRPWNPLEG